MAAPLFAVSRRSEEPIDHLRTCVARLVCQELADLLRRGRNTSEIIGRAPKQSPAISVTVGLHPRRFEFCENETVHFISCPGRVIHHGYHWILHRLERPELPRRREVDATLWCIPI